MFIMKTADWLHVARPILLVCISLAEGRRQSYCTWQVFSQSFRFSKSTSSRQSVTFLYVTDSGH